MDRSDSNTQIKGLDIARQFFWEWGLPLLNRTFPEYVDRIAAGRMLGSDVLGGDDAISRDHNWGPQFFLFLTATDFAQVGATIEDTMNAAAPNPWNNHRLAGRGDKSVIVVAIPTFFEKQLDLQQIPLTARDWADTITEHESHLYFVRHGAVFQDPLGELSAWRNALYQYPRHLQMKRLAQECNRIWHRGEYNFVQRMADRDDPVTITVCLGQFIEAVMQLYLLMNGDFTPYWKWLAREFRKQPNTEMVAPLLTQLALARDRSEQVHLVQKICAMVHTDLLAAGLVTGKGTNPNAAYLLSLENDTHELRAQSKIVTV